MSTVPPTPPTAAWTDWLPMLIVALPLGVLDVAICPLMKAISPSDMLSIIVYSSFGMILAQAGLLTCGLVFARGPIGMRFLVHWFLVAGLVTLWSFGFVTAFENSPRAPMRVWREVAGALCSLPAISLGLQVPLWGAKCGFGWNWQPAKSAAKTAQRGWRLSIFDLLVATAVVAGTLAVARVAPIPAHLQGRSEQQLLIIGLFGASGLGLSLIGLAPIVGIFQLRSPLPVRWGVALGIAFLLASVSLVIPASGLVGLNVEVQAVIGLYAVVFWYAVTVCGGLTLVEWRRHMEI